MGRRFMREDCRGMDRPDGWYNRNIFRFRNTNDTAAIELSTCQVPSSYLDFYHIAERVRVRGCAMLFCCLSLSITSIIPPSN